MTKRKVIKNEVLQNSEPDSLAIYLKNISHYKLLSIEEEVEISERMVFIKKQLSELDDLLDKELISFKEHYDRKKVFEKDFDSIKERMIQSNLRLVVSIAKKYQHRGLGLLVV